ncbi:unnamed protein product [Arabis nemorensis]|uniref:Uncharacterized protein n=1 Tax=Arabis nemorensis TaxID=586526 RepID=A0A565BBB2_9BRAS|nr:unnamed protein product [Arabis nemorensis]
MHVYKFVFLLFALEPRGNKVDGRSMRGKRKMSQPPRTPILKKLRPHAIERSNNFARRIV